MSWWVAALAWVALLIGLAVVVTALIALNRVLRPLREIERYASDTLTAGLGIARNLDGADEAVRTRELVTALRGAVVEETA